MWTKVLTSRNTLFISCQRGLNPFHSILNSGGTLIYFLPERTAALGPKSQLCRPLHKGVFLQGCVHPMSEKFNAVWLFIQESLICHIDQSIFFLFFFCFCLVGANFDKSKLHFATSPLSQINFAVNPTWH